MGGVGEGALGVAVTEGAVAHEIGADVVVQHGRVRRQSGDRIDDGRPLPIADVDALEPVFGEIAVGGENDRHGFADVADTVDGHRARLDGDAKRGDETAGDGGDLRAGQDRDDAWHRQRRACVDRENVGMPVRRAQDRRVERARPRPEIVDEAAAAGKQRSVLEPLYRLSDVLFDRVDVHRASHGRSRAPRPQDGRPRRSARDLNVSRLAGSSHF